MNGLLLMLLFVGLSGVSLKGAIINCPTCSQDDFENAYYALSHPGDTIVLPAGSATWGNSSRFNQGVIYIITNVTVIGAGDSTVITLDNTGKTYSQGVIALWAAATFKNMKFIGSSAAPVTAFQISSYNNPTTGINFTGGFRLSNITYVGGSGPSADAYFAFISAGVDYGLIDNCRITGNTGAAELIVGRGPTNAWQTNNTLGGANNIFIEDCTFNSQGYVCDANSNAHFVVRFCTINGNNKVDGHGLSSNSPPRSFRNMEVYKNHWTGGGASGTAIEIRGGTAMIFDNISDLPGIGDRFLLTDYAYNSSPKPWPNYGYSATITAGNPTVVTTSVPHGYSTGWHVWAQAPSGVVYGSYVVTVTGANTFTIPITTTTNETADFVSTYKTLFDYPLPDQIGVGKDPKVAHSEPMYLWNNQKNGGAWARSVWTPSTEAITFYRDQVANGSATFTETDVIQSNRDFFADAGFDANTGVSRGTKAQMIALPTPITGYGFWVTDEASWNSTVPLNTSGQLYTWSGSAWVLRYTPYSYPHPLRAPAAPTNLQLGP